jgi:protein-S-isoprenylcysteine O-methyltransferase Ste14
MPTERFDLRAWMFRYRSYTPLPFLALMIWFASPTPASMAAGFAIVLFGEGIRFWGVSFVGAETRTTGTVGGTYLVTNGPFAYVRNPLYVGNMLLYAGIGIMSLALFPGLLILALVWFGVQYSLIVAREEEYLAKRFGDEFREYVRRVPRFVPRLTPFASSRPAPKSLDTGEGFASERRTLQAIGLVALLIVGKYLYLQLAG